MNIVNKVPQMLTINEAAKFTGLAKFYIRQLCLQNKIIFVKAGRKFLINVEKLIEYLNLGENLEQGKSDKLNPDVMRIEKS